MWPETFPFSSEGIYIFFFVIHSLFFYVFLFREKNLSFFYFSTTKWECGVCGMWKEIEFDCDIHKLCHEYVMQIIALRLTAFLTIIILLPTLIIYSVTWRDLWARKFLSIRKTAQFLAVLLTRVCASLFISFSLSA